jgi:transcriptional regulator with XRE-family HTH domain
MTFNEWLLKEVQKTELSFAEIARRGGISHSRISQVLGGDLPGADFCIGIAKALRLPPEVVLRRANILPSKSTAKEEEERLLHYFDQLSPGDQQRLISIARALGQEQVK